ncbi:MAG: pilus assembly protein PilM [Eubacteriaceae bacterium]|nr:pilus assembly protein PilM [Eubacteriaceae bacterium]
MIETVYIATADGHDTKYTPLGQSRDRSFQSIEKALELRQNNSSFTLEINKYQTPAYQSGISKIKVYSSTIDYIVGDKCTYQGRVYERVADGRGTTPTGSMATPWKHVNIAAPTNGLYSESAYYELGNTVEFNNLTYVCVKPNNGELPDIEAPAYWRVCGEYNPIVYEAEPSISNLGGITISNGDANTEIIFLGNLDLSKNRWVETSVPMFVNGTFSANFVGTYNWAATLDAGSIDSNYVGSGTYSRSVNARGPIIHKSCASIAYTYPLTAIKTTDSRDKYGDYDGITLYNASVYMQSLSMASEVGYNIKAGVSVNCSVLTITGTCSITGYGGQIKALSSSTIIIDSPTVTLSRGGNTLQTVDSFYIDPGSRIFTNKRTAIARNGVIDRNIEGVLAVSNAVNRSYSTKEQDTGIKWIDGKAIYQITLQRTTSKEIGTGESSSIGSISGATRRIAN